MSMKSLVSLIKKFLCPPSQFMSMNPAYSKYSVGSWSYGFPKVYDSGSGAKLSIGKYCGFGEEVMILLSDEHNTRSVSSYPFNTFWGTERPWSKGNIEIGNDVWVGNRATIMSGVIIGDGAVIGAGAVVAKDVPAYAVAVGNPAQVVKYRFSQERIAELLNLRWWEWSFEKVKANCEFLFSLKETKAIKSEGILNILPYRSVLIEIGNNGESPCNLQRNFRLDLPQL